jgi:acyl-CoA thioesterase FadM
MITEERVGPAILRANVRYRRECRLGDQLTVTVEPLSARRDIGRLRQVIFDRRNGDVVCEAELTFVMLDLDQRKATKLPAVFLGQVGG